MDLKNIGWNVMDLFLVVYNWGEFLVIVNTVVDFGFYKMQEIARLAVHLSACSVGLSCFSFSFRERWLKLKAHKYRLGLNVM